MLEKVGEFILHVLMQVAITLAILVGCLFVISAIATVSAMDTNPSIITEGASSPDTAKGWHPPLLL